MRNVWVRDGDVDGELSPGNVVTATRELSDWCLRGDDGSEPIQAGAALQVIETRGWGAVMCEELPALSEDAGSSRADEADTWLQAAFELQDLGLYQVVEERPEMTPSGDIVMVQRAVKATRC